MGVYYIGTIDRYSSIKVNTIFCFADVNECTEGIHECAQICTDNIGSYECDCNIGYKLNMDQRTCTLSKMT